MIVVYGENSCIHTTFLTVAHIEEIHFPHIMDSANGIGVSSNTVQTKYLLGVNVCVLLVLYVFLSGCVLLQLCCMSSCLSLNVCLCLA